MLSARGRIFLIAEMTHPFVTGFVCSCRLTVQQSGLGQYDRPGTYGNHVSQARVCLLDVVDDGLDVRCVSAASSTRNEQNLDVVWGSVKGVGRYDALLAIRPTRYGSMSGRHSIQSVCQYRHGHRWPSIEFGMIRVDIDDVAWTCDIEKLEARKQRDGVLGRRLRHVEDGAKEERRS